TGAKIRDYDSQFAVQTPSIRHEIARTLVAHGHVQYAPGAIMKHGLRGEAEQAVVQIAHRPVDRLIRPASELHRSFNVASIGLAVEKESHAWTSRHQRSAGWQSGSQR